MPQQRSMEMATNLAQRTRAAKAAPVPFSHMLMLRGLSGGTRAQFGRSLDKYIMRTPTASVRHSVVRLALPVPLSFPSILLPVFDADGGLAKEAVAQPKAVTSLPVTASSGGGGGGAGAGAGAGAAGTTESTDPRAPKGASGTGTGTGDDKAEEVVVGSQGGYGLSGTGESRCHPPETLAVMTYLNNGPSFAPAVRHVGRRFKARTKALEVSFQSTGELDGEVWAEVDDRLASLLDNYAVGVAAQEEEEEDGSDFD